MSLRFLQVVSVSLLCLAASLSAAVYRDVTEESLVKARDAAVEKASKEFNFAIRAIARKRLQKSSRPYSTIRLEVSGDGAVVFERERADAITARIGGEAVAWLENQVSFTRREADSALVQTFRAEDGVRTFVYRMEPGEKGFFLDVKLESPKLDAPLEYTLHYAVQE